MHNALNNLTRLPLLGIMLGLALLSGCGDGLPDVDSIDSPESAIEGFKTCTEKIVSALEKIEDMDSFEANKQDLAGAYTRMLDIAQKAEGMEEVSAADQTELQEEFKAFMEGLEGRMQAAVEKIKDQPELAQAISELIEQTVDSHPFVVAKQKEYEQRFDSARQKIEQFNTQAADQLERLTPAGSNQSPRVGPADDPIQPVTIIVEDVPTAAQQAIVQRELTRIAQGKPVTPISYQNRTATFTVGLVIDPAAFANQITFGQVRNVDVPKRTITVRYTE